jgi:hypothetical protein
LRLPDGRHSLFSCGTPRRLQQCASEQQSTESKHDVYQGLGDPGGAEVARPRVENGCADLATVARRLVMSRIASSLIGCTASSADLRKAEQKNAAQFRREVRPLEQAA